MGDTNICEGRIILILCYHTTAINTIPPSCMPLKQCVRIRCDNRRNIIGGWFHVIINLQPLIPKKGNFFCPIGSVEKSSLNRIPWGRWRGSRILDLWWKRGWLFFKENISWNLLPDYHKTIGTMKGLHGKGRNREKSDSYERPRHVTWA